MDANKLNKMVQDVLKTQPKADWQWIIDTSTNVGGLAMRLHIDISSDVYVFAVDDDILLVSPRGSMLCQMDETTKKLFKPYRKKKNRQKKIRAFREFLPVIALGGIAVIGGLLLICANAVGEYKEKEQQAKVREYENTFPNYNDSIINAKTDADLQRAVMKQLQKEKMVERFADSLRNKNK